MKKNLIVVVLFSVFLLPACVHTDEQSQKTTTLTATTVVQATESSQGTTTAGTTVPATETAVTTVVTETLVVCNSANSREMVFLCTNNGEYDLIKSRDCRFAAAVSQRDGDV